MDQKYAVNLSDNIIAIIYFISEPNAPNIEPNLEKFQQIWLWKNHPNVDTPDPISPDDIAFYDNVLSTPVGVTTTVTKVKFIDDTNLVPNSASLSMLSVSKDGIDTLNKEIAALIIKEEDKGAGTTADAYAAWQYQNS